MEANTLIKKYYFRVYLACFCAAVLALAVVLITGFPVWLAIVCLIVVLLNFYDKILTLKRGLRQGRVVLVYGTCISKEVAPGLLGRQKRTAKEKNASLLLYRFLSISASQAQRDSTAPRNGRLESENLEASFYIKAEPGKYRESESYAFLFFLSHEPDSDGKLQVVPFTENNLIISDIMEQAPFSEKVLPEDNDNRKQDEETCDDVRGAFEDSVVDAIPDNAVKFKMKGEQ